jgi:hypothetical protein
VIIDKFLVAVFVLYLILYEGFRGRSHLAANPPGEVDGLGSLNIGG